MSALSILQAALTEIAALECSTPTDAAHAVEQLKRASQIATTALAAATADEAESGASALEIEIATNLYGSEDIEIDSDAKASRSDPEEGLWVAAWVWITPRMDSHVSPVVDYLLEQAEQHGMRNDADGIAEAVVLAAGILNLPLTQGEIAVACDEVLGELEPDTEAPDEMASLVNDLRCRGYAVVQFSADEIGDQDPVEVWEQAVAEGNGYIGLFGSDQENTTDSDSPSMQRELQGLRKAGSVLVSFAPSELRGVKPAILEAHLVQYVNTTFLNPQD